MVNAQVQQWIQQNYPSPTIDPEWLEPCCEHITSEDHLDPDNPAHFDRFVQQIEFHLLNNALQDSMVPETGIPIIPRTGEMTITGPILVEVRAIMEVGHSAYDLWRVRAARQERGVVRLSGREDEQQEEGQEDEDEGPIPKYPRGMLDLVLTDGSRSLKAMEYRFIPEIVLGETRLGHKVRIFSICS
ncbi:hypothetical protein CONPUDRAFT_50851 [Coniophora puteana RWD-64-598 SS2]|uniref:RecQ-mediated genome instability protein 1 n=1 Tax=Coniophora puteana (strain RWD-64-598) TaxID=741705 RepID=A0A5M3MYV8_CONPW|nr:uncharacterized protein CONPUDRAFT_50851 [Coniophora puteana RWD-64-598 SS2]EIW84320.1 hypothetical protein CONPUDRAFT_50851 [Coniophora puteana RWD-64-598 SS2]